jgi:hypothetical protein
MLIQWPSEKDKHKARDRLTRTPLIPWVNPVHANLLLEIAFLYSFFFQNHCFKHIYQIQNVDYVLHDIRLTEKD